MKKINLGIIYGGVSTEHEVSIKSGESIIKNLDKEKYNIYQIYIDKEGNFYADNDKIDNVFSYLQKLDVVFPILHGLNGEDGTIQGMLEILDIPYVGCNVISSALGMDKLYAKIIFTKANLNVVDYICLKKENNKYIHIKENFDEEIVSTKKLISLIEDKLSFPVFIKPSKSGSSVGVNKVYTAKELKKNIDFAFRFDDKVLIEKCIKGRELECAVLGNNNPIASSIGQIITNDDFYSYEAKYISNSKTIIPNDIPDNLIKEIKNSAIKAFKALEGRGLSRVDFFLEEKTNKIYINEINTMPGFTEISMYPILFEDIGIPYKHLLDRLIDLSLNTKQC